MEREALLKLKKGDKIYYTSQITKAVVELEVDRINIELGYIITTNNVPYYYVHTLSLTNPLN